jgi:hypothetical protein
MQEERARLNAERALLRQSVVHHLKREQELERQLAGLLALAHRKPQCKCEAAKALRHLAHELEG